jgi:hypothetical protein
MKNIIGTVTCLLKGHIWSPWYNGIKKGEVYRYCYRCSDIQDITGLVLIKNKTPSVLPSKMELPESLSTTANPDSDEHPLSNVTYETLIELQNQYQSVPRLAKLIDAEIASRDNTTSHDLESLLIQADSLVEQSFKVLAEILVTIPTEDLRTIRNRHFSNRRIVTAINRVLDRRAKRPINNGKTS